MRYWYSKLYHCAVMFRHIKEIDLRLIPIDDLQTFQRILYPHTPSAIVLDTSTILDLVKAFIRKSSSRIGDTDIQIILTSI